MVRRDLGEVAQQQRGSALGQRLRRVIPPALDHVPRTDGRALPQPEFVEVRDRVAAPDGRARAHRDVPHCQHTGPDVGGRVDVPAVDPPRHHTLQRHGEEREEIGEGETHLSPSARGLGQTPGCPRGAVPEDISLKIHR